MKKNYSRKKHKRQHGSGQGYSSTRFDVGVVVIGSIFFAIDRYMKLHYLYVSSKNISELPDKLPSRLKILECDKNQITELPELPNSLTKINCSSNQIIELPKLPNSLEYLDCNENKLTSIPDLPSKLILFNCGNNEIISLPKLPDSLKALTCENNQLTILSSLPNLPPTLELLICSNNKLILLPQLPDSLYSLYCSDNKLTRLPTLPNSLLTLYCFNNKLISFPNLPDSIQHLECNNNQLTSLPNLPNSLVILKCQNNPLTSLPQLPNTLKVLECNDDIIDINNLPSSLIYINEIPIDEYIATHKPIEKIELPTIPLELNNNDEIRDVINMEDYTVRSYFEDNDMDKLLFVKVNDKGEKNYATALRSSINSMIKNNVNLFSSCVDKQTNEPVDKFFFKMSKIGIPIGGLVSREELISIPSDKQIIKLTPSDEFICSDESSGNLEINTLSIVEPTFISNATTGGNRYKRRTRRTRKYRMCNKCKNSRKYKRKN